MRTTSKPALLTTVVIALLVSVPRVTSAQDSLHKTRKALKSTTTHTNPKAPKGTIEISSFQFGASRGVSSGKSNGAAAGKAGGSISEVGKGIKANGTAKPNPIYKGPRVIVPPTGGQPNDSAHKRPPH